MASVKMVNYLESSPRVRKVFDDIMTTRKSKYVNNIWRVLANYPPILESFWSQVKAIMIKPSRIDPLTKELIYLAVSITNNCDYCINSHTAGARSKGMDDEILGELNAIVGLANAGNRYTQGYQVPVDSIFRDESAHEKWSLKKKKTKG